MSISRKTAVVLASALIAMPALAAAQEPVKSFDQLNTRLKPGDTVWITDAQGREVKGKITALGADALTLNADGAKTFPGGDVRLVQERRPDSLANGALIGFAVGAAGPASPAWPARKIRTGAGAWRRHLFTAASPPGSASASTP